jgi:hypothetical protein
MSHLVEDTPFTYCYVRAEFLYDLKKGHGKYVEACIIGVVALEGRAPAFTVMLRNGALWARLPLHALTTMRCYSPLPLTTLCLWDCLSYDVTVHQYSYLTTLIADVFCGDGEVRHGKYLFTLDWCKSSYSEMPDQHKQHHILALDTGHLAAMPGNRLRWHEPSWVQPFTQKPDYNVNTHEWTAERDKAIENSHKQFYNVAGEQHKGKKHGQGKAKK